MKMYAAAIIALLTCSAPAFAQEAQNVPLATVARQLGLVYAYLGPDDIVSLSGPGLSVTVRPGEPFFYVNDRSEPVAGGAPTYRGGDIYVGRAFVKQLAALSRVSASAKSGALRSASSNSMRSELGLAPAGAVPRRVTDVHLAGVEGSDNVLVTGKAPPGALVALVLKAISSPQVPTVFLNRSFVVAARDGTFDIQLSTAPEYFQGSVIVVEASGIDDAKPVSARYTPPAK